MKNRTITHTRTTEFEPYDLDGPLQQEISLLRLSYDCVTREGSYMMRMQPGAETIAHTHRRLEEFIILKGSLIEDDGTVLKAGDHVIYEPDSHHNSRTEEGCLLLAIDWLRSTKTLC